MLDFDGNAIFEPDTILASQLRPARAGLPAPEHALMVAVLEEAVRCLTYVDAADRKQRALAEDAEAWFASTECSRLYDFENVCDVLGIDAGYFREGLRRRADRRTPPHRPAAPDLSDRAHRPARSA